MILNTPAMQVGLDKNYARDMARGIGPDQKCPFLCLPLGCVDRAITTYKADPTLLRNTIITMAVTAESSCLQRHLNATITERIQLSVAKCKILFAKRDELVHLIEKNAALGQELLVARKTYEHIAQP